MTRRFRPFVILAMSLGCVSAPARIEQSASQPWRGQGVVHLDKSPYAKLRSVPIRAVRMQDGFWGRRRKVTIEKSIPSIRALIEEHGYADNFRRLSKSKNVERKGPVFADTDPYKWVEAVGVFLQSGDQPQLRQWAEEWIDEIVAIQEPGGYLNTNFVGEKASQRLIPETMEWGHELYSLGHMLQAAIAYYRATGNRKLLDAGIKFADYLARDFGPDKKPLLAGHPEVEMALVELYRTTGERRHLELAGYLLNGDKRLDRPAHRIVYTFSGTPFTARARLQGHAVRAMYACSGATDYYLETGDRQYWGTLERLWQDMLNGKMYVTGGLGSRWDGESFGASYELPNSRAYAETCAAIGSFMWNWRMLAATGDARFTDVMERALYNAINVGMSLDGMLYCYANPLESSGKSDPNWHSKDGTVRNPWYDVLCCPPNIQRTLGALPGYLYSTSKDGIYAHFFESSDLDWRLEDGTGLKITQKTGYPWEGNVDFTLNPERPGEFTLYLRIPGWAAGAKVSANGQAVNGAVEPGKYLALRRRWQAGDRVRLELDMTPQLVASHPLVLENAGRVAVQRGPLVYCLERTDQPGVRSLQDVALAPGGGPGKEFRTEFRAGLLGGVTVLKHRGTVKEGALSDQPLYRRVLTGGGAEAGTRRSSRPAELTFIPYYAWANREPSPMRVWIPYDTGR